MSNKLFWGYGIIAKGVTHYFVNIDAELEEEGLIMQTPEIGFTGDIIEVFGDFALVIDEPDIISETPIKGEWYFERDQRGTVTIASSPWSVDCNAFEAAKATAMIEALENSRTLH